MKVQFSANLELDFHQFDIFFKCFYRFRLSSVVLLVPCIAFIFPYIIFKK